MRWSVSVHVINVRRRPSLRVVGSIAHNLTQVLPCVDPTGKRYTAEIPIEPHDCSVVCVLPSRGSDKVYEDLALETAIIPYPARRLR